jgi:hypothetical protein
MLSRSLHGSCARSLPLELWLWTHFPEGKIHLLYNSWWLLSVSCRALSALNVLAAISRRLPVSFITHPEGIAKSVSQQLGWGYWLNAFAAGSR